MGVPVCVTLLPCNRCVVHVYPPGKKLLTLMEMFEKAATFVEFPGFVSRTGNKAYMDYLRIPHGNLAQSLLSLLFLVRLL
jgi:hypothetical protein